MEDKILKKLISLLLATVALVSLLAVSVAAADAPAFTYQLTTVSDGRELKDLTALNVGDTVDMTLTIRRLDTAEDYQAYGVEFDLLATGLDFQSGTCSEFEEISRPSKSVLAVLGGCRIVFAWADMVRKVCKTVPNPLTMTCTFTVTEPERASVWLDVALVYPEGSNSASVPTGEGMVTLNVNGGVLSDTDITGPYAIGQKVTLPNAVRNGYILKWYDGAGYYEPGTLYEVKGNVTLTAIWSCAHADMETEYTSLGNGFHSAETKCINCGEVIGTIATKQCSFELKHDENSHWKQCVYCGYTTARAGHSFAKGVCTVCGIAEHAGSIPGDPSHVEQPIRTNPFADVKSDAYYYDAVLWAAEQGITGGTTSTTFSPNHPCTRAQVVTFLWRAAGSPAPMSTTNPFTDVKSGAYYYDAVLWAVEQGITKGTTTTKFSPDITVNRGQTVTFLYRAAHSPAVMGSNPFVDVRAGMYYENAVLWAVEQGITNGTTDTTFSPAASCTRGQIVTFLYRAAKN